MSPSGKRIKLRQPTVEDHLPDDLPPLLRRVYLNRGVGEPEQLDLGLNRLHSYHDLKNIDQAASLLADAIEKDRHIVIVGDFDADGATSTALAMLALGRFGAGRVSYLVPDRFRYGYGLTPEIVDLAKSHIPDLIITVDNGISSLAGVEAARQAGIQVLITDHHLPGEKLPGADVIVNPNQPGCKFPSKNLAGVGVIFYVMAALRAELRQRGKLSEDTVLSDLLDLVALGTVADVVSLDYNNRILVEQGLERIRHGRCRPGLLALIEVAGRNRDRLGSQDLAFFVAPRLNAAGRLEDMSIGIECLLSDTFEAAKEIAQRLHDLNAQRRDIQAQMQMEAEAHLDTHIEFEALPVGLCLYDPQWHEGIVGLVASRIKERYHRPSIAFAPTQDGNALKGSARSIPGLHIRDALDAIAVRYPGLITKFGGHAMAAGLSIHADSLDHFRAAFEEEVSKHLEQDALDAVFESDGEIQPQELNLSSAEALAGAGPWGQHFPEPLFHGRFHVKHSRVVGDKHLKLGLTAVCKDKLIDAIAFNAADNMKELGTEVTAVYRLDINEYMGKRDFQLIVEDLQSV